VRIKGGVNVLFTTNTRFPFIKEVGEISGLIGLSFLEFGLWAWNVRRVT